MNLQLDTRMLDERRFLDFHFCGVVLSWGGASPSPDATPLQNYITELKLKTACKSAVYTSNIKQLYPPSGKHAMFLTLKVRFHSFMFIRRLSCRCEKNLSMVRKNCLISKLL